MSTVAVRAAPTAGVRGWWWANQRKVIPYLFIAPFFVLFCIFGLYPIVDAFWLSLQKGFGFAPMTFFGGGNYVRLVQDPRYVHAVLNTTYYAAGSVFVLSPLALLIAVAVASPFVRWKAFYRVALFFPVVTSSVVIAVIFSIVLDPQFGLVNQVLAFFRIPPVGWLTDTRAVMPAFILLGIWNFLGVTILYWTAGLNSINNDYYDAAAVDGATRPRMFWHITVPLLRPVTLFVVIQAIVGSYNLFAQPWLLTQGGPSDSSMTISLYLYTQGFENLNAGYASAIAYSMAALLLVLSVINIVIFRGYDTRE